MLPNPPYSPDRASRDCVSKGVKSTKSFLIGYNCTQCIKILLWHSCDTNSMAVSMDRCFSFVHFNTAHSLSTAPVYSVFFCFFVLDFIYEDCTLCRYVYHKSTTHSGFLWELRFSSQQVAFKFNSVNRSSINTPLIATYCWCLFRF